MSSFKSQYADQFLFTTLDDHIFSGEPRVVFSYSSSSKDSISSSGLPSQGHLPRLARTHARQRRSSQQIPFNIDDAEILIGTFVIREQFAKSILILRMNKVKRNIPKMRLRNLLAGPELANFRIKTLLSLGSHDLDHNVASFNWYAYIPNSGLSFHSTRHADGIEVGDIVNDKHCGFLFVIIVERHRDVEGSSTKRNLEFGKGKRGLLDGLLGLRNGRIRWT